METPGGKEEKRFLFFTYNHCTISGYIVVFGMLVCLFHLLTTVEMNSYCWGCQLTHMPYKLLIFFLFLETSTCSFSHGSFPGYLSHKPYFTLMCFVEHWVFQKKSHATFLFYFPCCHFYWFERQGEGEQMHSPIPGPFPRSSPMASAGQGWSWVWNSIHVSHMGGRHPVTGVINFHLSGCTLMESQK